MLAFWIYVLLAIVFTILGFAYMRSPSFSFMAELGNILVVTSCMVLIVMLALRLAGVQIPEEFGFSYIVVPSLSSIFSSIVGFFFQG